MVSSGPTSQTNSTPQADNAQPCNCAEDPGLALKQLFVDNVMGSRLNQGQTPGQRPVFLKPHGVARGLFTIRPDLPAELRVGIFKHSSFPAWVRFSSDTLPTLPDLNTTLGIGIKLFGVPGPKLLEAESEAPTHDFIMQNHDVFFVDTALDMCEFIYASVVGGDDGPYRQAHPQTQQILDEMQKVVPSVLLTSYWSVLPYAFGSDRYVKYKLVPRQVPELGPGPGILLDDPAFLQADLRRRLLNGAASFNFYLQFRTDQEAMPLDAATVRWDESLSSPVLAATLTLLPQDITARGQAAYGENLAFDPWHALPEHKPVGSVAEARRVVYQASAELRRNVNGVPLGEPAEPRPLATYPPPRDQKIVRAAIHPAIGIARVGNSENEYFIGPEVIDPEPVPPGFYRDKFGALKRQAARFRIYGYNAAGEVVTELTADKADITWTVHVANKKAAWYQFQIALDIPEAAAAPQAERRNKTVTSANRSSLIIDPGPRSIHGRSAAGEEYFFNTGTFLGRPVYLGELRTDEKGRLLFLGGRGVAAAVDESRATDFANNDNWYDDTSDGPVTASVSLNGETLPVDPAWVVVAPPNYAPDVLSVRTMYDLLFDVYVQQGWIPFPSRVSFTQHIYPIFQRLCNLQWVNNGFAIQFGWGGQNYFLSESYLARLASQDEADKSWRRQICNSFRNLDRDGASPLPWPWLYGDAMSLPPASARQHLALSPTAARMLQLWAEGNFDSDWDLSAQPPRSLSDLPLAQRPEMLNRAALTFCLADAFHPGCELTWPMRHPTLYMAPFRIRHRAPDQPEPNYGKVLTPEAVLRIDGPLYAQAPGDLTRWMAVPWQTDTASCRAGYDSQYDPYLPTFWPARVPNHVLTEDSYRLVMDTTQPRAERVAAFQQRAAWYRQLAGKYVDQINQMVQDFGRLGVVEARPGIPDDPDFPPQMLVESKPETPAEDGQRRPAGKRAPLQLTKTPATGRVIGEPVEAADEDEILVEFINKVKRFVRL